MRAINPPGLVPSPFYSHGIELRNAERLLFISGQVGMRADRSVPEAISEQVQQAYANLHAVLAEAGMTPSNLVKVTVFLTNAAHIADHRTAVRDILPDPPHATTLLVVSQLADPRFLVEVEAIAATVHEQARPA